MASTLPNNPSLDRLRDDARRLQRGITIADRRALEIVRRHHPRPDVALAGAPGRFALHDAQLTVARGYGFTGWPALVHYLEVAADLSVDPSGIDEDALEPADRFCTLSSLRYDDTDAPPRRRVAADLLNADPGLVERHVWAAASAADPVALLFAHGLADAGPSKWERRLGEAIETREQMWQRQVAWAAEHGFADRLDLLARHGVDVSGVELVMPAVPDDPSARDQQGATPLHQAAWAGDLDLIQRLLDAGADPTITDLRFGSTPLGWAEHAYQTEAADLLRPHTPD